MGKLKEELAIEEEGNVGAKITDTKVDTKVDTKEEVAVDDTKVDTQVAVDDTKEEVAVDDTKVAVDEPQDDTDSDSQGDEPKPPEAAATGGKTAKGKAKAKGKGGKVGKCTKPDSQLVKAPTKRLAKIDGIIMDEQKAPKKQCAAFYIKRKTLIPISLLKHTLV